MGVLGLWQILESVGHPIKIEGLEGKRLGVDANVWLYKFIRGFREKDNATSIDSHKLGLYNRISKLLYYKIKPIFVFDGPAPVLKRRTLERRQNIRNKNLEKAHDLARKLLAEQLKESYPGAVVEGFKIPLPDLRSHNLVAAEKFGDEDRELFYLPPEVREVDEENGEDDDAFDVLDVKPNLSNTVYHIDSDDDAQPETKPTVDIHSEDFKNLPAEIRYEILQDIKESRRRLRRAHALPEDAGSFSDLQLKRLRGRRLIQEKIEQCEKDICSAWTGETDGQTIRSFRVQSDSTSTLVYTRNESEMTPKKPPQPDDKNIQPALETESSRSDRVNRSFSENRPSQSTPRQRSITVPQIILPKRLSSELDGEDEKPSKKPNLANETICLTDSEDDDSVVAENLANIVNERNNFSPEVGIISDDTDESNGCEEISPAPNVESNLATSSKTICLIDSNDDGDEDDCEILHKKEGSQSPKSRVEASTEEAEPLPELHTTNISWGSDIDFNFVKQHELENAHVQPIEINSSKPEPNEQNKESNLSHSPPPQHPTSPQASPTTKNTQPPPPPPPVIDTSKQVEQDTEVINLSEQIPQQPSQSTSRQIFPRPTQSMSQQQATIAQATRTTNKVTSKIIEEAKELLRLFGVPYIDAAGEAEAQCALLEKLKLTEGTITDDSDVWLFGAQNVYRYFFSDDKYVMQYKMTDIEFHIRMTRENLVCFAMLVGSDYTDGIMNIGPVTALEVLSEFPGKNIEPLERFKNWKVKYEKSKDRVPGSKKRERLLKFRLPDEFPSRAVFDGYMRPVADSSTESFTWGTPELDELRDYAARNFGWDSKRIDDKLLPVMKKLSERKTQPTIDSFFFKTAANQNPELFRSKRVNQALQKIAVKTKRDTSEPEVVLTEDEDDDGDKDPMVGTRDKAGGTKGKTTKAKSKAKKGPASRAASRKKETEPKTTTTTGTSTRKRQKLKSK